MSAALIAGVALGGAAGATLRHLAVAGLASGTFPRGTVVANTVGSAVLGATLGWADVRGLGDVVTAVLATGLAGGLTTFSTLAVDALRLARGGRPPHLWTYLALTGALGIAAAWAGFAAFSAVASGTGPPVS